MIDFSADTAELAILANDLRAYNIRTKRQINRTMDKYVGKTADTVRKYANGRPGPNRITGRYANSIKAMRGSGPEMYKIVVWSDHPASHRLEYGFVGIDSMGRIYHQPPYPHFRPAIAEISPRLVKDLRDTILRAWFVRGF